MEESVFLQEPQNPMPSKLFGSESMRRSQIERLNVCVNQPKENKSQKMAAFVFVVSCFWFIFNWIHSILLQLSVDALIKCVTEEIGFSQGKPVAAFTIYKCLLRWRSFEAEKTSVFDYLIQVFGSATKVIGECHYNSCGTNVLS